MHGSLLLTKKIELFSKNNEKCSSKVFTLNQKYMRAHSDKGQSMELKNENNSVDDDNDVEELILSNNLCYGDYIDLCLDWFKLPVFFVFGLICCWFCGYTRHTHTHTHTIRPKICSITIVSILRSRIRIKQNEKKKIQQQTFCLYHEYTCAAAMREHHPRIHALMRLPE